MAKDIFEFLDYKAYLEARIDDLPNRGRGARMGLAKEINSPVSHVSQVLNGNSNFSLEQAESANTFFGHTEEEADFFLLLVQFARAGTPKLRKRLETQIRSIKERRLVLKDRLGVKAGLSKEDQTTFYSSWLYGTIHVMVTIPEYQTKEAISSYLGLSLKKTSEILEFLVSAGLVIKTAKGKYEIGTARIHLGSDSPLISKFHTNWRMQAVKAFDLEDFAQNLHYSSVVTLSQSDVTKVKSLIVKLIEEAKSVIRDSPAEELHSFSIDFFKLSRSSF